MRWIGAASRNLNKVVTISMSVGRERYKQTDWIAFNDELRFLEFAIESIQKLKM